MNLINGYLVVTETVASHPYRGVDRDPWENVDAAYYRRTLPEDIHRLYSKIRAGEQRDLWWPTALSRADAVTMLSYSRSQQPGAELIAVHSPYLEMALGRSGWKDDEAELVGVDMISVGEWSLLKAIQQAPTELPENIAELINESGLLRDQTGAARIEEYYRRLAEQEAVEPIADLGSGVPVELVSVYSTNRRGAREI